MCCLIAVILAVCHGSSPLRKELQLLSQRGKQTKYLVLSVAFSVKMQVSSMCMMNAVFIGLGIHLCVVLAKSCIGNTLMVNYIRPYIDSNSNYTPTINTNSNSTFKMAIPVTIPKYQF